MHAHDIPIHVTLVTFRASILLNRYVIFAAYLFYLIMNMIRFYKQNYEFYVKYICNGEIKIICNPKDNPEMCYILYILSKFI